MTVTLVRPASGGLTRFGIAMPVRVRPAPAMLAGEQFDHPLTRLGTACA